MTLLEWMVARNIQFRRHSSKPNEIWLCCPFCLDSRFRLGVNLQTNMAHCFNGQCDYRSRKASSTLAYKFGTTDFGRDLIQPGEEKLEKVRLPRDFTRLWESDDYLVRKARKYAVRRGLTRPLAKRWGVGVSLTGRFGYRVIFPVRTDHLVGLVARDFTDCQTPKYLMSSGRKFVWGIRKSAELILCEGVFKALNVEKALAFPSGALLGHAITDHMLADLKEYGLKRAILWPDVDPAGVKGIINVAGKLQEAGIACYMPVKPPEVPADDASMEQLQTWGAFDAFHKVVRRYQLEVGRGRSR